MFVVISHDTFLQHGDLPAQRAHQPGGEIDRRRPALGPGLAGIGDLPPRRPAFAEAKFAKFILAQQKTTANLGDRNVGLFIKRPHFSDIDRRLVGIGLGEFFQKVPAAPRPAQAAQLIEDEIQSMFDAAYRGRHDEFKEVLLEARDYIGTLLARTSERLSPHNLTFGDVGDAFLSVDRELTGGKYQGSISESFVWREIGAIPAGPRLDGAMTGAHVDSAADTVATQEPFARNLSYRQRMEIVHRGG